MECRKYNVFQIIEATKTIVKQAGAELCQAQTKLGPAKPSLPSKKRRLSSILKDID